MALLAFLPVLLIPSGNLAAAVEPSALPDAPQPQSAPPPVANPCDLRNAGGSMAATAAVRALTVADRGTSASNPHVVDTVLCVPHLPIVNWYARFLNGPQVKALTPVQKAHLAVRNLIDPFNLLTIGGEAAISVAANSHSVYGPGFQGWGKYMGVSFTQDMVGEFFGTFLIPSVTHEDPHYHRLPQASIKRRVFHAAIQIVWTEGDRGKGMVNYSNLVGFAFEDAVNDLYVPGQQTNFRASAERYGIALATAPIDNYITEFVPDIASRIHVRVVLVQRIINQIAVSRTGGTPAD
ncbi:MAG TPA: hypothetical protein VL991_09280 [Terracidiphilus sp.]|nr:hypothetical protein [Terracidiphilus sp.]